MTRLLLSALPADTAAQDAAALAAAVSDLGALATVMVCATVVLVFVARGAFTWLTAREERLKAQPPQHRSSTPPAGPPSVSVIHADLRALEERIRALENKEASSSTAMSNLRDEIRKDMAGLKETGHAQSEAIQQLTQAVTDLRHQLDFVTRTPFGTPKTGG
jgi:BMFP domain-containing protein YqiC